MKAKLFYLTMVIVFTLTSCKKEAVFTNDIEAAAIPNNSNTPTPLCIDEDPFGITADGSGSTFEVYEYGCYYGPLDNLQYYKWTIIKSLVDTNTGAISYEVEFSNDNEITVPELTNNDDYYSVLLKAQYDNGSELKIFCFNNHSSFSECGGSNQFETFVSTSLSGGPGAATASLILP